MSASVQWKIDPVREVEQLNKAVRNKVIRIAMNKASAPVKASVVDNARKRHGYLKKSIRIRLRNYQDKAVWVSVLGPKRDFYKRKGKYKRGPKRGQFKWHRPSNYARLLERGTKHASAKPFLKPALLSTQSRFATVLQQSIREQIAAQLPKS